MSAIDEELPKLIFLDILLDGPDGFTFLNELASYSDTAKIPIIIVSSIDISGKDLSSYGVVKIVNKEKMTPAEIKSYVNEFAK
jgi:CheY-like chemotaxis protein